MLNLLNPNTDYVLQFHYFITFFIAISPYILPLNLIKYYLYFYLSVIMHWYFLKGRCFIVKFQKKENNLVLMGNFLNLNKIFDFVIFTNILFSFYRIDNIKWGIRFILLFLMLNKIIYNNTGFRIKE